MTRLFIAGLPPDITPAELSARFTPFGTVSECTLAMEKEGSLPHSRSHEEGFAGIRQRCRGFGHIELQPNNETALSRCLSTYNHCKWRGGVLRVEVAKQGHAHRYATEVAKETAAAEEKATSGLALKAEREASMFDAQKEDLRVAVVCGIRRCKVWDIPAILPKRSKLAFPACTSLPLDSMEWSLPETDSSIYIRNTLQYLPSQEYIPSITPEGAIAGNPSGNQGLQVAAPVVAPVVPKARANEDLSDRSTQAHLPSKVVETILSHESYGMLKIFKAIDNVNQKLARSTTGDTVAARAKARAAPQKARAAAAAASISDALGPQEEPEETVDFMEGGEKAAFAARTTAAAVAATAPRLRALGMPVGGITTRAAPIRAQAKPSGGPAGASPAAGGGMDRFDDASSDDEGFVDAVSPQASDDGDEDIPSPLHTQSEQDSEAFSESGDDDADLPSPVHTESEENVEAFEDSGDEDVAHTQSKQHAHPRQIVAALSKSSDEEMTAPSEHVVVPSPKATPAPTKLSKMGEQQQTQQAQTIARLTAAAATAAAAAASAAARLEEAQSAVLAAQEAAALAVAAVNTSYTKTAAAESMSDSENVEEAAGSLADSESAEEDEEEDEVAMEIPLPAPASKSANQISQPSPAAAKFIAKLEHTPTTRPALQLSKDKLLKLKAGQSSSQAAPSSPIPTRLQTGDSLSLSPASTLGPITHQVVTKVEASKVGILTPAAAAAATAAAAVGAVARISPPQVQRRSQPVGAPVQIWIPSRPAAHAGSGGGGSRREQMLQRFGSDSDEDICDVESEDEGGRKANKGKAQVIDHVKPPVHISPQKPSQVSSSLQQPQSAAGTAAQRGSMHQTGSIQQVAAAETKSHVVTKVTEAVQQPIGTYTSQPKPEDASLEADLLHKEQASATALKAATSSAPTRPLKTVKAQLVSVSPECAAVQPTAAAQIAGQEPVSRVKIMPQISLQAEELAGQAETIPASVVQLSPAPTVNPAAVQEIQASISVPVPSHNPSPHQTVQTSAKTQALPFRFGFFGGADSAQPAKAMSAPDPAVLIEASAHAATSLPASASTAQPRKQQPAARQGGHHQQQQQQQQATAPPSSHIAPPSTTALTSPQRPGFSRLTAGASFFRTGTVAHQTTSLPAAGLVSPHSNIHHSAQSVRTGAAQGQSISPSMGQEGTVSADGDGMVDVDAAVGSDAWQAQRVLLTADWKSKHRAAVRKSAKQKPKSLGQGGAKRMQRA